MRTRVRRLSPRRLSTGSRLAKPAATNTTGSRSPSCTTTRTSTSGRGTPSRRRSCGRSASRATFTSPALSHSRAPDRGSSRLLHALAAARAAGGSRSVLSRHQPRQPYDCGGSVGVILVWRADGEIHSWTSSPEPTRLEEGAREVLSSPSRSLPTDAGLPREARTASSMCGISSRGSSGATGSIARQCTRWRSRLTARCSPPEATTARCC